MATEPTTTDQKPSTALAPSAPAAPPDRVPVRMGVAPTSIDEGWRLATLLAKSELVPKVFRNKPEDVLVAIQMGIEIGLAPMQALQSIAVINGRPSVWGDGFLALIVSSPLYQDHDEFYEVDGQRKDGLTADDLKKDTTVAVCTFWRKGKERPVTRRFSIAQAKKASLLGKEGPWQTYPDRQLAMRARGFAGRDAFPDLLRGIRTAEEAGDIESDAPTLAPVVHRRSESTAAGATPAAPTHSPVSVPETASAAVETLDPLTVIRVERFLGYAVATLGSGITVHVEADEDAHELGKFAGTDHKLRLTVARVAGEPHPRLHSFAIAD